MASVCSNNPSARSARNTRPIPPEPSSSQTRYGPRRSGGGGSSGTGVQRHFGGQRLRHDVRRGQQLVNIGERAADRWRPARSQPCGPLLARPGECFFQQLERATLALYIRGQRIRSPAWLMARARSRNSQARDASHRRFTVAGEMPSSPAVASIVRPTKNRSSTSRARSGRHLGQAFQGIVESFQIELDGRHARVDERRHHGGCLPLARAEPPHFVDERLAHHRRGGREESAPGRSTACDRASARAAPLRWPARWAGGGRRRSRRPACGGRACAARVAHFQQTLARRQRARQGVTPQLQGLGERGGASGSSNGVMPGRDPANPDKPRKLPGGDRRRGSCDPNEAPPRRAAQRVQRPLRPRRGPSASTTPEVRRGRLPSCRSGPGTARQRLRRRRLCAATWGGLPPQAPSGSAADPCGAAGLRATRSAAGIGASWPMASRVRAPEAGASPLRR